MSATAPFRNRRENMATFAPRGGNTDVLVHVSCALLTLTWLFSSAAVARAQVVTRSYYNSFTGAYAQGASAYNPITGRYLQGGSSYNPYTGTSASNRSLYNPYTGLYSSYRETWNPYTGVATYSTRGGWR